MLYDEHVTKIRQQYRSIASFDNAEKVKAIKDLSLNPFLFEDSFDGLTNSLYRWTQEAPAYAGKSERERTAVASTYYDNVLAPMYQHMKVTPLDKDIWLHQAWGQALKYDPAQSYHSHVVHGLIEALPGVIEPAARAGQTIYNAIGLPIAALGDSIKHGDYTGLTGFANLYLNMQNRIASGEGFFKALESEGEKAPVFGAVSKFEKGIANYASFWHDVTPNRSFTEKATSFVAENAMLLPLFGALNAANAAGIGLVREASAGVPVVANLTEALNASKAGRFVGQLLASGTEGLTWGVLTRKDNDKKNSWEDALNFAAMGSLFSLIGKHAKAVEARESAKAAPTKKSPYGPNGRVDATPRASNVIDGEYIWPTENLGGGSGRTFSELLPEGEERTKMLEAEHTALTRSQGYYTPGWEENLEAHRVEIAHNIAAGGMAVQHAIFEDALDHVAAWGEHFDTPETKAIIEKAIQNDPASRKPVFSSANLIMKWLKENKLSHDIVRNPLEHEKDFTRLIQFLKDQSTLASLEMNLHVKPVQEAAAAEMAGKSVKTPEGQARMKDAVNKAKAAGSKDPVKDAKTEYLNQRKEFVAKATEAKEVTGAANVERELPKTPPRQRVDSHFEYDPEGKPTAYSMNVTFDWRVAKENLARSKGKSAKEAASNTFWQNFVDSTTGQTDDPETANRAFVEDLWKYFNPLKNAGLRFERGSKSGGEIAGGDYTNFLGHIYSYRENLPLPVRHKVEELLMNSPKMFKILGSKPTFEKLERFSQSIENHVDMFMRSKWYRDLGQRHIFRSTQPRLGPQAKTKWQLDLIDNTWKRDIARARNFYPGQTKAMREARQNYITAISAFYGQEIAAVRTGNEKQLTEVMEKVRERIQKERKR